MNSESIAALRREVWQKKLYKNIIDNLYFAVNGIMGTAANNIVQIKDELKKGKGDTVTFGITSKNGKASGVAGGAELEGNETKITPYAESVVIGQFRDAVRLSGLLDEQMNSYNMREDAKEKLSIRIQEFIEQQIFLKLGGCLNQTLTDINGTVLGTLADGSNAMTWSNSPDKVPDADTAAGYGDRYLCADYTNGADSLAATDLLTPGLISRAKIKAETSVPKMLKLRIGGENMFVMFIHPWQAFDLKNNATFNQARREAEVRGKDNPIFTGALGIWDGVVIKEHEYVPFLDVSAAGHNFYAAAAGTDIGVDCFRALLCGQQAIAFAKCNYKKAWVEKLFDYDDQTGFASGLIGGIQKVLFNSKNYGVIQIDTAATALV